MSSASPSPSPAIAELLRRAVENVIRNAIRHAPPETAVEVKLARNNGRAVVDIRDHGPGVPEEALPRLFDPFYRVETDRNRTSGGIGLGLSIARRAIELHKGTIRARNARPGLEVELDLPVRNPLYRSFSWETDRNRTSGGIGLGISIARPAIELHKGAIRARNARPGLEVELDLPLRNPLYRSFWWEPAAIAPAAASDSASPSRAARSSSTKARSAPATPAPASKWNSISPLRNPLYRSFPTIAMAGATWRNARVGRCR